MAEVLYGLVEPVGPFLWRINWAAGGPGATFYVYGDGRKLGETAATFWEVPLGPGGRPVQVQVFDDAGDVPDLWYPPTVTLEWAGRDGDVQYLIEAWDGAAWVAQGAVLASVGPYQWESPVLPDGVAYLYRVVPVDGQGRRGTGLELGGVMCRYPDAPLQTAAWDDGEFVIS